MNEGIPECGVVTQTQALNAQRIVEINCPANTFGDYVYIKIPGEGKTLGLCEVTVEGPASKYLLRYTPWFPQSFWPETPILDTE